MEKDNFKKSYTRKESLLYSILIFNFWIPLFLVVVLFSNTKQIISDGEIARGGITETCKSVSYDPRGGGGNVCDDGSDYNFEPVRYLSFGEATIEDLGTVLKILPFTLILGIGFSFYFFKMKK